MCDTPEEARWVSCMRLMATSPSSKDWARAIHSEVLSPRGYGTARSLTLSYLIRWRFLPKHQVTSPPRLLALSHHYLRVLRLRHLRVLCLRILLRDNLVSCRVHQFQALQAYFRRIVHPSSLVSKHCSRQNLPRRNHLATRAAGLQCRHLIHPVTRRVWCLL